MTFDVDMLTNRIKIERESVTRDLRSMLRHAQLGIQRALVVLDDADDEGSRGHYVDPHLIHNVQMLTSLIARWNLVTDLEPLLGLGLSPATTKKAKKGRKSP